jgi:metallo-beta-lactamase
VGAVTEDDLKDRRVLGEEGFVSVVSVIDRAAKRVVTGPDVHARGIAEDDSVFDEITPKITAALEDALRRAPQKVHTTQQLQQIVRRTLGAWVSRRLRRKPMIVPVVVEHKSGPEAAK